MSEKYEFREAAGKGDLENVKLMLKSNPSLVSGTPALHWAASRGQTAMVEFLLANNADVNATDDYEGDTPLHLAAQSGHTGVAKLLIEKGANVNATNSPGKSPLWYVTVGGSVPDLAQLLRQHGAH